jgi:hypothetical protein
MRRNPVPRRSAVPRRRSAELPAVPTVKPEVDPKHGEPARVAIEEDAEDEAVRRMVEAAYT